MPPKFRGARVLIGIIANDAARFSEFSACVTNLQIPEGHRIEWVIGGDWCGARNSLARLCVDGDYSHLWFMDDDHAFAPDILMKLLRHDVALVNPMCFTRTWPFQPVTYLEDGALDLASVPERGLVELHAGGAAGMLIRRDVLGAIPEPWFEYADRSEDVIFCEKAKAAGFPLYGDLEARLGHITTAVVWPSFNPEHGWMTGLTVGKDMQIQIPLTSDLVNHEIRRIEVPFEEQTSPEPLVCPVCGQDWTVAEGHECPGRTRTAPLADVISTISAAVDHLQVSEPCLICGEQSSWRDVHGRQGCPGHPPTSEAWQHHYERIEMWYVPDETYWYFRVLRSDGTVATLGGSASEASVMLGLEQNYPGVQVFQIANELDDSRKTRTGPPLRLWDRKPT